MGKLNVVSRKCLEKQLKIHEKAVSICRYHIERVPAENSSHLRTNMLCHKEQADAIMACLKAHEEQPNENQKETKQ